jgi:PAS domain S-box-containing protein
MLLPSNIPLQKKLVRTSVILALAVLVIILFVLAGWAFNIDSLIRPLPDSVAMNPVTALSLFLAALAFIFISRSTLSKKFAFPGYMLATLVLLIGLLKIADSLSGIHIPVDKLLFPGKLAVNRETGIEHLPTNMALNTAISLVLTGIALLLLHVETNRKRIPGQFMALLVSFASFLSILLYLYKVPDFGGQLRHIPMAIHTAICFLLLSVACLFIHPDKGIMRDFTSPYAGSVMARILVPVAICIPVFLGLLRLIIYWNGSITTELGVAVLVLSIILVFLVFIRYSISVLNKKDFQREQAEASLRKSKEQIQELFDASPDATVIVDEKGVIKMANNQTEILFGYSKKELIGQSVEILLDESKKSIHQQHRKGYMQNPHTRLMGTGLQLEAVKKSSDKFPVEISLSPLHTDEGLMISASIRDVTERKKLEYQLKRFNEELEKQVEIKTVEIKESEENYRQLIERITDGFFSLDKDFRFTYVNKKAAAMGLKDPDYLVGKNIWKEFPEFAATSFSHLTNSFTRQEHITYQDYFPPSDLWFENNIYPSPDGVSVFTRDITARKKAEVEMMRVNDELHLLSSHLQSIREEERIHIAREIHDELGQQLTGLKMYVHNLQKNWSDPKGDNSGLINDIIELTGEIITSVRRISSNLRPPILDDLGLVPALEWQSREVEKRSAIKVEFESELFLLDLPVHISTGLFRIYQEALNNAVKYSNARLITGKLELKDEWLLLEIKDDGKGMDIAEPGEKKTFGLLGIQERTHMMKGKYELDSKPGEGTRIRIAIPLNEIIN